VLILKWKDLGICLSTYVMYVCMYICNVRADTHTKLREEVDGNHWTDLSDLYCGYMFASSLFGCRHFDEGFHNFPEPHIRIYQAIWRIGNALNSYSEVAWSESRPRQLFRDVS
jgi:hypothetical protein